MLRLLVFSLVFAATSAAITTTSTSCDVDGTTASGPLSCNIVTSDNGRATAMVDPVTTLFSGTSFIAWLGAEADVAQSFPLPGHTIGGYSFASATSDLSLALTTNGSQRPGLLRVTWEDDGSQPYDGLGALELTIGPWSSRFVQSFGNSFVSQPLTAELGQPFTFDLNARMMATAAGFDARSGGFAKASVTLQFYEADGTTLATIVESNPPAMVPEPKLLGLLVIVFICFFVKHTRTRVGQPHSAIAPSSL